MKIKKVLNNNAVTVMNNDNREIVVMGLGLAFKKRAGDELEEDRIERVFTLENKEVSERLKNLISEIPAKYVEISEEIIKYAEEILGKKLNENIYLTLTDHISFAITRNKQGLNIKNPMLWEIKRFYKQEYEIGLIALNIIKENFEITLLEDEAASIALHIVNAELNQDMPKVVAMTKVIQEILNIIRYNFKMDFDEESLSYHRLVTHLKFFAQRMMNETTSKGDDEYLYEIVIEKYDDAYKCVNKIKTHLKKAYNLILSKEEMTYLTIHIQRVVNRDVIK
ncbi:MULTISPECIES: BglG family transcription antiterminator LicT [Clostridium]|uniref:PRD domain-containing protein n=1 Tax=Clostridium frigoriphilum TaxID=443253 RepID=A0ABU7UN09_9CLOT|nr:PRD domain-containing protein [Clostridium sp. DSM 17811]MBU3097908.1 PRD domain-containing protein [Clostridium sp. DSM 17811]